MNALRPLALILGGLLLVYVAAAALGWVWGRAMDKCLGPVDSTKDPRG